MYILPNEAMELLQITTRQGLHKVVVNHNVTVKSQGAGKPNLYLKADLEKYITENKEKIRLKKKHQTLEKAATIKKEKIERKVKAKKLKVETKKQLGINEEKSNENWTVITGKDNVNKVINDLCNKDKKTKKQTSTKKELKLIEEDKPVDNLFDDEDIIKPPFNPNEFEMKDLLNEIGQNEFDRVVQLLQDRGTYKEEDRALVLTYAVSFQNWVFATVASAKQDNTTSDQFGNLKLHPYFQVAKECAAQMSKNASMLGIGARNRIGLEIAKPKKQTFADVINAKEEWK